MTVPLLRTKLYIPPVRPGLVPRPHLIERLNAGLHRKLTLICAPAGFGKTTLLSEWAADCDRAIVWVSLDEGDNDPARFLGYLVAALQTVEASIDPGVLSALQSPRPPPLEGLLTMLINRIDAILGTSEMLRSEGSPHSLVLVLDDYHLITAQPIHDALTFLLDHLPPQMHLVIASRADPPLPVARLRGRGELTELRQADLCFTPGEATELLNQVMGLELSSDDVAALASRTEGWIAGLQMAAVSIQGQKDVSGFVQAFTGSDRYILDYLVEEVLQRQPNSIQTFLLQTSILDRLTPPLCEAVTGRDGGQAILERLERANLFIVPLDNERRWYRYHRLFADLLRARLRQHVGTQGLASLHRRASGWYEENGLMASAIDHALSAGDFERAADSIEQIAETTLMRSEVGTLLRWMDQLPDDLVCSRSTLCLYYAWALQLGGRPQSAVESRLQHAEQDTALFRGKVAPLHAVISLFKGQARRAAELSRRALEQLPEDEVFFRGIATWILALSKVAGADLAIGSQVLREFAQMSQETGNVLLAAATLSDLGNVRRRQGQLFRAKAIYEQALQLATDRDGHTLPIAGEALTGLGKLSREWNDLESAARYTLKGIELTGQWSQTGAIDGYIALARLRQAQGDVDGAEQALQEAQRLALQTDSTELDDHYVALQQARLWVARGDVESVARWVERRGLAVWLEKLTSRKAEGLSEVSPTELLGKDSGDLFLGYVRPYEYVTLAKLLIKQDRPEEAQMLLQPLQQLMKRQGQIAGVIEIRILEALAFQAQSDMGQAMAALEHALALAEPEGYVRIFVDEGLPMAQLLHQATARGIAPEYVGKLLTAFDLETGDAGQRTRQPPLSSAPSPSPLIEPLSKRELEVLRLVAEGLSNREIAERLVISLSTVKGHTSNIYSKLAVKGRTQAVARARVLDILPDH